MQMNMKIYTCIQTQKTFHFVNCVYVYYKTIKEILNFNFNSRASQHKDNLAIGCCLQLISMYNTLLSFMSWGPGFGKYTGKRVLGECILGLIVSYLEHTSVSSTVVH